MRVKLLTATILPALLAGCTSASPSPTNDAGSPPTTGAASPGPIASAIAAQSRGATGDLRIALGGDCLLRKETQNQLRLTVPLVASWLGTRSFPATGFTLALNGGSPVSGSVTSAEPVGARIGVGTDLLNRTVRLNAAIDPANAVNEFSETNNATIITVTMPAAAPADTADHPVPCA